MKNIALLVVLVVVIVCERTARKSCRGSHGLVGFSCARSVCSTDILRFLVFDGVYRV